LADIGFVGKNLSDYYRVDFVDGPLLAFVGVGVAVGGVGGVAVCVAVAVGVVAVGVVEDEDVEHNFVSDIVVIA